MLLGLIAITLMSPLIIAGMLSLGWVGFIIVVAVIGFLVVGSFAAMIIRGGANV